jgi:pre-mRNA-processing factor SLU7
LVDTLFRVLPHLVAKLESFFIWLVIQRQPPSHTMSASNNNPSAGTSGAGGGSSSSNNIVNPHNPEFLTKKPWYLGGQGQDEPTLDHQSGIVTKSRLEQDQPALSLTATEEQLDAQRRAAKEQTKFYIGQWVEALKKRKLPYRICQVLAVNKQQTEFDLQFEDGSIERKVRLQPNSNSTSFRPAVRMTKTGSRSAGGAAAAATGSGATAAEAYDAKRDAYHGYDKDSHNVKMTAKFEQREALRRKLRKGLKEDDDKASDDDNKNNGKKKSAKGGDDSDFSDSDDDDKNGDEFVQRDEDDKVITTRLARQGGVGGAQMKVTARNLRIREDTAKYLRNLDPNSAYYDPKSRSMRDNPHPELDPTSQTNFAGDNFSRISGDAIHLAETQLFAWDAASKGVAEIHPQANPSQAELLKRQFETKATDLQLQQKKAVLDKYGGAEYLDGTGGLASAIAVTTNDGGGNSNGISNSSNEQQDKKPAAVDRKLRFGVSTTEEKYGRDAATSAAASGNKKSSMKRQAIPCKYEEDIFINGHSTVWGSFFHKGAFQWGYEDDHSLLKLSYCTGQAGKLANDEANEMRYGTGQAGSAALAQARSMLSAQQMIAAGNASSSKRLEQVVPNRSKLYGEANQNADLDQEKVQQALERAKKREQHDGSDAQELDTERDDRKRKYHSIKANDQDMTEEDMEAYRLQKDRSEDPMANLASGDADALLEYK